MWSAVLSPRCLGVAALLIGIGIVLSGAVTGKERTLRGRVQRMGAGTVQSFVRLDPDGAPGEAIAPGRCGELADCGDFKRATRPVPAPYLPSGYIDVGAVVPRMGNHLLDSQSPELKDSLPFTSTFIYGAYEGELIFWEPMITTDVLKNTPDACFAISQPQGFQQAGYYPTQYCVRQNQKGERTVSLERFHFWQAS